MKNRILSAGALTAIMLFSPIAGNSVEASTLAETSTQQSTQKIMWGASELTSTQIGRITFLKDTKLYKRDGKNPVQFHLNAKKGSMWRVHKITKEGNMNVYDLGGGVRVQQSNLSKYEVVPTDLIQKQVKENGAHISWANYDHLTKYPQVRRLASKDVEDKINENIKMNVRQVEQGGYGAGGRAKHYSVTENKNNRLEISFTVSGSTDDDNGIPFSNDFKLVYDLVTGKSDFIQIIK
ncbi:hypothetical protein AEA09_05845 [Lysinibacillus contaminans]|uniref:Uncharacterized protein n=1 Tax=Lysinibacillus contaminans TaxID=1293441 RepID=A0ABR5JZN6_9BACI|nr:hypothetical protein [Lysinibacillus contaminans]KOS68122.1 hypothetical protein AEA09_05845 [Lysinibacillus contaminans]